MNTLPNTAPRPGDSLIARWIRRAGFEDEPDFILRVVQPALVGLIDGTVSSLAPIFAAAIASSSHTALLVGFSTALGGLFHTLPFIISDVNKALVVAGAVVAVELFLIAWIRNRFLEVSMRSSLLVVTVGGVIVLAIGVAIGSS